MAALMLLKTSDIVKPFSSLADFDEVWPFM